MKNPAGAPVFPVVTLVSPDDLTTFTGYREKQNARRMLALARELGILHAPEEGRLTVRFRRDDGRQMRVHAFIGSEYEVKRRLDVARRDQEHREIAQPNAGVRKDPNEGAGRVGRIIYW